MAGRADYPLPEQGLVLTHFVVVRDVARSRDFYAGVLGGEVVREADPGIVKVANGWIILNPGGGPTPDKPEVTFAPPADPGAVHHAMTIRVPDCRAAYETLLGRGAEFLTPPVDYEWEVRCFFRDPDGHLLELSESKPPPGGS